MEEISNLLPDIPDRLITVTGQYTFRVGETFQSFEQLEQRLELHCSESLVYYWRRDTRTVKGAYTKTSRPLADRLKYYSLRYACVFGGEKKKSRSQGKRQNSKTLRKDCPSFIGLRASKNGEMLEVVAVCNEHNHECSTYVNQSLPHTRKIPDDIKQEVVEMMLMHIDRKKIIEYVKRKTNKSVTVKDLFNLKAKYKHLKLERSKDEMLQLMGISPVLEEQCDYSVKMEDSNKEWITVCYDENVIEYDEYSVHQDESNVEIDVEVQPDDLIDYTETSESERNQFNDTDDIEARDYQINNEETCLASSILDNEFKSVDIEHVEKEVDTIHNPQEFQNNILMEKRLPVRKHTRASRLKWFIQRENSRNKRRLLNCKTCGTNSKFLSMQISVLQAEKEKLVEETNILRLTKAKLIHEVSALQLIN